MNEPIASDLETRLNALAAGEQQGEDFDARSWFWLVMLGMVIPALLLVIGWYCT
ncbi:MAG: hypothetical protein JSS24_16005 [Proteobacteria bacterium]|nr:hypothetical protein [Pseudomonadota bacterium]